MQHADSTLTPKGRHRMVQLVEVDRLTFEAAPGTATATAAWVGEVPRCAADPRR